MLLADLHIHSRYSRATSRDCTPEALDLWARRKGIAILGTGDFTHPAWRQELQEKLVPAGNGLYRLRPELRLADGPDGEEGGPYFAVTGEISSIYKKNGRVRKVHNLLILPGLEAAEALSLRLEAIGNLHSDGRPILGLDSRDLLEILLETCPDGIFIPAHIWTPHFSLFGAFSGFDTIEECFEDLTPHITALETGLSADPAMIRRLSALDRFQLISNSDAHSPARLGREANLLDIRPSYAALADALRTGKGLCGTVEFFPEEGKYHFDGHRNCGVCLSPAEAEAVGGICPVCGKKLTPGVLHRVEQLADRPENAPGARPFESLVPLPEVIGASTGYSAACARTEGVYLQMLRDLGPEFRILRDLPLEDIRPVAGPWVTAGIRRLREGKVLRAPGFDGEYGKITLFTPEEVQSLSGQTTLFTGVPAPRKPVKAPPARAASPEKKAAPAPEPSPLSDLNPEQLAAAASKSPATAVIAGPGTGKTKTLTARIRWLVETCGVSPSAITAVTFTNKAAAEMRQRLEKALNKRAVAAMHIGTFHSICLKLLGGVTLADESEALALAGEVLAESGSKLTPRQFLQQVSRFKNAPISGIKAARTCPPLTLRTNENSPLAGESLPESAESPTSRHLPANTPSPGTPNPSTPPCSRHPVTSPASISLPVETAQPAGTPQAEPTPFPLSEEGARYCQRLKALGLLDFDDLLLEALRIQGDAAPGKAFSYLLADEFQDVNDLQYRLLMAWNRGGKSLFVIGDPDQSIYGFRGSDARCFDRLAADLPELQVVRLVRNYRSAPEILRCALPVIDRNPGPVRQLTPQRPLGQPVQLVTADDDFAEAVFIAKEINRMVGGIDMLDAHAAGDSAPRGFSDIAVLYRTHRQAEVLEKCLTIEGIPYTVTGRDPALSDGTVRGTLGFFRNLLRPEDRISLQTCLRTLLHCPKDAAGAFSALPPDQRTAPLPDSLAKTAALLRWQALAAAYLPRLREKPRKLLESWVTELGLAGSLPMEKLLNTAVLHGDLPSLLRTLDLGEEGDVTRSGGKRYHPDAVTLSTLHGAKGLEFPVVFLCGCARSVLPLNLPGRTADPEEERRLFYVGLTRGQEELILTVPGTPSPFLADIPGDLLRRSHARPLKPAAPAKQLTLF